MKQIKFPYAALIDSNYTMVTGTITSFDKVEAYNDSFIAGDDVLLEVHTTKDEHLVFHLRCEPPVTDYYREAYEHGFPVTLLNSSTSYLVYDPGVSNL